MDLIFSEELEVMPNCKRHRAPSYSRWIAVTLENLRCFRVSHPQGLPYKHWETGLQVEVSNAAGPNMAYGGRATSLTQDTRLSALGPFPVRPPQGPSFSTASVP